MALAHFEVKVKDSRTYLLRAEFIDVKGMSLKFLVPWECAMSVDRDDLPDVMGDLRTWHYSLASDHERQWMVDDAPLGSKD